MKKLLLILVMFMGMNNYGMNYDIKAICSGMIGKCFDLGRDVMDGQYNRYKWGLIPATYLGLEMAGFFNINRGKGAYDPEGFWKKRARIVLGTSSVIACGVVATKKVINGEYDKNLLYSVAGIFAGLGCFRLGAYKNMIPSFLRTKKLKEQENECVIGSFIENHRKIHPDLRKYAPTKKQVLALDERVEKNARVKDLIKGVRLIKLSDQIVGETNRILGLIENEYHSYMRNRTTLWGLAYAYLFKLQYKNPYHGYLDAFQNWMQEEQAIINNLLEEEAPIDECKRIAPDNFVRYIMPQKRTGKCSQVFWRINKYLYKKRDFWTNLNRYLKSLQPLTKFTENGVLLIDNRRMTADREAFYASLITYGFDVQLKTPVLRDEDMGTHYFDEDGNLKGMSSSHSEEEGDDNKSS